MNQGWIKLHRQILEWEWYTETNTFALFMHLLLTCNFKSTNWRGIELEAGETIKGIRKLSEETKLSLQNVRTAIKHLKSTGELTERQHGKHRILKLKNYTKYQLDNTETNKKLTSCQHSANTEVTHDKERKNVKNEKKVSEDTAKAVVQYGGKEINNMLKAIKETIGLEAFSDSGQERNFGKHLVGLYNKIGKVEFKRRLDYVLDDDFRRKNCNSIKYLYNQLKSVPTKNVKPNFVTIQS